MNEERRIEVEEVDGVAPPPKARVSDTFERKRDYLEGFLAQQPPADFVLPSGPPPKPESPR